MAQVLMRFAMSAAGTKRNGLGAYFTDLPPNMLGSFLMGLLAASPTLGLDTGKMLAILPAHHAWQVPQSRTCLHMLRVVHLQRKIFGFTCAKVVNSVGLPDNTHAELHSMKVARVGPAAGHARAPHRPADWLLRLVDHLCLLGVPAAAAARWRSAPTHR